MQSARNDGRRPVRPYSYSESQNESPRLVNDEPLEIERDVPETQGHLSFRSTSAPLFGGCGLRT
jgi:hypothetical protein